MIRGIHRDHNGVEPSRRHNIEKEHSSGKHDCGYLVNALSIVVVGASGDLAKKKVQGLRLALTMLDMGY